MKSRRLPIVVLSWLASLTGAAFLVVQGCSSTPSRPDGTEGTENTDALQQPKKDPDKPGFTSSISADPMAGAASAEIATDLTVQAQQSPAAAPSPQPVPNAGFLTADPTAADFQSESVAADGTPRTAPGAAPGGPDEVVTYVVQNGDTLMKISYNTYADVYRWKEIFEANKGLISNPNLLTKGTVIRIHKSGDVEIIKNGKPYLIHRHDTLAKISSALYGSASQWPRLWKNNQQLIHDPNRIYAGFQLYYLLSEEERPRNATPVAQPPLAQAPAVPVAGSVPAIAPATRDPATAAPPTAPMTLPAAAPAPVVADTAQDTPAEGATRTN